MTKISFAEETDGFYSTLKTRVNSYFMENKISPYGNLTLYLKTLISLIIWITLVGLFLTKVETSWWKLLIAGTLLGITSAYIGFNVMHDASHNAYSKKKWVNNLLIHTLSIMGALPFLWVIKHVVLHHSFVNTDDDDDIETHGTMRFTPHQKKKKIHRWQHIYAPFLYSLLYIFWILTSDIKKYFKKKIKNKDISKSIMLKEHITFWVVKISYTILFLIIPFFIYGLQALWFLLPYYMVCGFLISIVFQLAHIHEYSSFEKPDIEGKLTKTFAEHQLSETIDFGTNSKVLTESLGGLNFQTIHHLFPRISHVHYKKIQSIIIETCNEFQKRYICISTRKALLSHFSHLKNMGRA